MTNRNETNEPLERCERRVLCAGYQGREGSFGAEFLEGPAHLGVHPAVHPDARALVGRHTGLTLRVSGLLPYCERLHERGVRFIAEPTRQSFGVMAMIADPDGNIFALWDDQLPDSH